MQQAVLSQDGCISKPAGCLPILMTAGHGVQKGGITGGYADISNEASGVRGGADRCAVFKTGAKDATLGAPIGFAKYSRRVAANGCSQADMTAGCQQVARQPTFNEVSVEG